MKQYGPILHHHLSQISFFSPSFFLFFSFVLSFLLFFYTPDHTITLLYFFFFLPTYIPFWFNCFLPTPFTASLQFFKQGRKKKKKKNRPFLIIQNLPSTTVTDTLIPSFLHPLPILVKLIRILISIVIPFISPYQ